MEKTFLENYIDLHPSGPALTPLSTPPDLAFSDEFENGNFSAWTNTATDYGDLAVTADAAYQSIYGLKAPGDYPHLLRPPISEKKSKTSAADFTNFRELVLKIRVN